MVDPITIHSSSYHNWIAPFVASSFRSTDLVCLSYDTGSMRAWLVSATAIRRQKSISRGRPVGQKKEPPTSHSNPAEAKEFV